MTVARFINAPFISVVSKECERRPIMNLDGMLSLNRSETAQISRCFLVNKTSLSSSNTVTWRCSSIIDRQTSEYELSANPFAEEVPESSNGSEMLDIYESSRHLDETNFHSQSLQTELIVLSLPAIGGQAIEPLAQLMEMAYIGRLGPLELASAGVSMSIFNIVSKIFNIPLLSVATSFVAEDISKNSSDNHSAGGHHQSAISGSFNDMPERKMLPSVSTALVLAIAIGVVEAMALYFGSGLFLDIMGISSASAMRASAENFLKLRALGAPAVVVSLAIQGIFRGFKDTKTPVLCLGLGNFSAVFLFPILMYSLRLGVTGAALSTVFSQYIVAFLIVWYLNKRTVLSLPSAHNLHFGGYLKSGGFLLGRTAAAVMTISLSTAMAARLGTLAMAAHQICLQVWLSISLLVDALAAAGQAMIASSFAKHDYSTVKKIAFCAIKTGLVTGLSLALLMGVSFSTLTTLFTNDTQVLKIAQSGLWFVSASLPVNALAYVFDGLHYGVSDFSYAGYSMMIVGALASAFLFFAPSIMGLSGVWSGLTLFMGLRILAGYARIASADGPWAFLHQENL